MDVKDSPTMRSSAMKKINEEDLSISTAVSMLLENGSNMLQFHVFSDIAKTKPIFAAFFVIGENGEPGEAIDKMMKLKSKWDTGPKIEVEGDIETSYMVQQLDLEGPYRITRECKSLDELCNTAKQCGIRELSYNQRIIKRIDIPLGLALGTGDSNGSETGDEEGV